MFTSMWDVVLREHESSKISGFAVSTRKKGQPSNKNNNCREPCVVGEEVLTSGAASPIIGKQDSDP